MSSVELSVIIPSYNVEPWIEDTLRSIVDQQGPSLEIIVVDDGSTDNTVALAQRFAEQDSRVRVLRSPGSGGAEARNYGVSVCSGDYLCFADADDVVPPGAYEALFEAACRGDVDLVVGDFLKFSSVKTWRITGAWGAFDTPMVAGTLAERPGLIRNRACWNRVFRRQFWMSHGITFPNVPRSNDVVPMTTALTQAKTISVVARPVYLYRERPGGSSMTAKAAHPENTVSYLTQESHCAELIARYADAGVTQTYWKMVLGSDCWNHVSNLLRAYDGPGDSTELAEVCAAVRRLSALAPSYVWAGLSPRRRVVYALLSEGLFNEARALVIPGGGNEFVAIRALEVARRTAWSGPVLVAPGDADSVLASVLRALMRAPISVDAVTDEDLTCWVDASKSHVLEMNRWDIEHPPRQAARTNALLRGVSAVRDVLSRENPEFAARVTQVTHQRQGIALEAVLQDGGLSAANLIVTYRPEHGEEHVPSVLLPAQVEDRIVRARIPHRLLSREGDWDVSLWCDYGHGPSEHLIAVNPVGAVKLNSYARRFRLEVRLSHTRNLMVIKKAPQLVRVSRTLIRKIRRSA